MSNIYNSYKPLRNMMRQCNLEASLVDVWQFSRHIMNDAKAPVQPGMPPYSLKQYLYPWDLPTIAREVVLRERAPCPRQDSRQIRGRGNGPVLDGRITWLRHAHRSNSVPAWIRQRRTSSRLTSRQVRTHCRIDAADRSLVAAAKISMLSACR